MMAIAWRRWKKEGKQSTMYFLWPVPASLWDTGKVGMVLTFQEGLLLKTQSLQSQCLKESWPLWTSGCQPGKEDVSHTGV